LPSTEQCQCCITSSHLPALSLPIDDLVIEATQKAADNQGISANRWVELYLFDSLKNMGFIAQDEQKLGENKEGDRKSEKFKN
jgi:hypothetical protein